MRKDSSLSLSGPLYYEPPSNVLQSPRDNGPADEPCAHPLLILSFSLSFSRALSLLRAQKDQRPDNNRDVVVPMMLIFSLSLAHSHEERDRVGEDEEGGETREALFTYSAPGPPADAARRTGVLLSLPRDAMNIGIFRSERPTLPLNGREVRIRIYICMRSRTL